jgi:hypothetical protein
VSTTDSAQQPRKQQVASAAAPFHYLSHLENVYQEHQGSQCTGLNWAAYSLDTLKTIAACLGGPFLAGVFEVHLPSISHVYVEQFHSHSAPFVRCVLSVFGQRSQELEWRDA